MIAKYKIEAFKVQKPIAMLETKFGGQPNWISEPCWPLSKSLQKPMKFLGQFVLYPEIFGSILPQIAYLFMTDSKDQFVSGTWLPDGGENAVILQPGKQYSHAIKILQGPTIEDENTKQECEYGIKKEFGYDNENQHLGSKETSYLDENKIGGTPFFLQYFEYPGLGRWKLIAQIQSTIIPQELNFGDAGIGYIFLSHDISEAKFIWQSI